MQNHYTIRQCIQLFGNNVSRSALINAEKSGLIPKSCRRKTGKIATRVWSINNLSKIGFRYGFLGSPIHPTCITIFSAKGGVFKSTLALNIARMAALHDIRTCVIGLDFQCDITRVLGITPDEDSEIETALVQIGKIRGLGDFLRAKNWNSVLQKTDIPTLDIIPETGELITLDRKISAEERREYILKEQVIDPLKEKYQLIVIDCSPNWNHLISNAIVSCDLLISPLECKISQFNNLTAFRQLLDTFRKKMSLNFRHLYVPTRYTPTRRLSVDIRNWYMSNMSGVTTSAIRECALGEESIASKASLPEHNPNSPYAEEMRNLLQEIWSEFSKERILRKQSA